MLLEKIINITIDYYNKNKIAYFTKNNLNIKFRNVINENNKLKLSSPFIHEKSTVDYYGIYEGKYITFEAKSTSENSFPFSNIKLHQHEHLQLIKNMGGYAFYIIFFKNKSKLFKVDVDCIDYKNKKSISFEEICEIGTNLEIIFPGIVDFLDAL
ncbi:MAG: Holliday junction resolvase RecU [Mycoplasma sp.]|nr:Holliday junction resolvase RecU [Mycoplasma sp.]